MATMKLEGVHKLVISIVVSLCAGGIGSLFTFSKIPTWYAALQKPAFTPPDWLFAPAWTVLYVLMGIAAFYVWRVGSDKREVRVALVTFLIQLIFNALWSVVFFGMENLFFGAVMIVALWIIILFTIIRFYKISQTAAWLLIPYILWVTFASALNIAVWLLNA